MEVNRIVGDAPCLLCEHAVKVRLSKKNFLYYVCEKAGGGCGHQVFSRDPEADKRIARRITKWVRREDRIAYLGDEVLPAKARPPAPEPTPEPAPEPEPELEELEEPELPAAPEPTPAPPPAPAPQATRRAPKRQPSKPPKAKSALDKLLGF